MVKKNGHNAFSVMGRIKETADVRRSRQADGGYVGFTLNVQEETWDAQSRSWVPSVTQVPLSFYSKAPEDDAMLLVPGYTVIVDGHLRGRSYSSQGEQKNTVDLRIDNIDVIEPHLTKGSSITPGVQEQEGRKGSGLQAGYREQAKQAEPQHSASTPEERIARVSPENYNGPIQTVEQFDDDQIPF